MKEQNQGFTLMEMMTVIAIISILTAIVVPNFNNMINKSKHKSDLRGVIAFLNMAKIDAQKYNSDLYMTIDENAVTWTRYYIEEVNGKEEIKSVSGSYPTQSTLSCGDTLTRKTYVATMFDTVRTKKHIPVDFIITSRGRFKEPESDGSERTTYIAGTNIDVEYGELHGAVNINLVGRVKVAKES